VVDDAEYSGKGEGVKRVVAKTGVVGPRSLDLRSFFHYRGFYHGDWVGESKTFLKCMQRMQYLKIGFKCMILKRKW
jgi:hypothetical protein